MSNRQVFLKLVLISFDLSLIQLNYVRLWQDMILFQSIICLPTTILFNEGGENLTVYISEPSIQRCELFKNNDRFA
jgi:hypothetical protein